MRSRVLLVVFLVLAVSLTLVLLLVRGRPDGGGQKTRSDTPERVEIPGATDGRSMPALEPTATELNARSSARTAPPDAAPAGAESARKSVLSGRLIDARGQAVAGARIFVARADRVQGVPLESMDPTRLAPAQRLETSTDERGVFSLTEVPTVPMRLAARSKGHAPHDALIAVTAARHDLGDIVLADSVVLTGRVLDRARRPVSGATLRRLKIDASPAEILGESPDDVVATTDGEGLFRVDELASGPWVLLIKAAKHPDRIEKGETKTAGQVVSGLEFVLDDGAVIEGRVVNAPPALLENVWVTAVPADGGSEGRVGAGDYVDEKRFLVVPRRVRCAPDGSFTVAELTANLTYRLAAQNGENAALGDVVTKWVVARAGDRKVELFYQAETALVFQAVDAATSLPITEMDVRVGKGFMLPLSDEKGQPRRSFPEGRARFENLFKRPLEAHAELVIEARGYTTLRVGDLVPVAGRDLDLGILRLERAPMVRVKVVDAQTARPVAGARVALMPRTAGASDPGAAGPAVEPRSRSTTGSALQEDVTNADGRVELNSLPGETAVLSVSHADFAPQESAPLALAATGDREETIELHQGGSVLLAVKDALGAPVRGERIEHSRLLPDGPANAAGPTLPAITNALGQIRFEHLNAGRHRFAASPGRANIASSATSSVTVEVVDGGEHTATIVVPERARVTGRVTDGGQALSGATLRFARDGMGESASGALTARTNGNGDYALNDVEWGGYRVSVVHPTRAMSFDSDVSIDKAINTFDVALPRTAIEGRVFDEDGRPVSGIQVRVEQALAAREAGDSSGVTDANGKYVLLGVKTAVPLVIVVNAGDYQPFLSEPVTVTPNEVKSGVDLRLAPGAALEVAVTSADGRSLAGCRVSATCVEDARVVTATTNAAGRAHFKGLRPGAWRVRAQPAGETTPGAEAAVDVKRDVANTVALELR